MATRNQIPRLPYLLFRWYCKRELYEELHGDLEEFFYERVEEKGLLKAKLMYWLDVIKCCQPYAWKDLESQNSEIIMLKNYFKTGIRSMRRAPLSTFINVSGLSVAIAICMVVYAFMLFDYSIDTHHENKDVVFLTTSYVDREGELLQYGFTPCPLGEAMLEEIPQVIDFSRLSDQNAVMKHGDNVFHERIRLVDPSFLQMMTFPLSVGNANSLNDLSSVILSYNMAIKYFGELDVVGEQIKLIVNDEVQKTFAVAGVAEPFPDEHIIDFEFLINLENITLFEPTFAENNWAVFIDATLIQVDQPQSIVEVSKQMTSYVELQNEVENDWPVKSYGFSPIATLHHDSGFIKEGISYDGRKPGRITLPLVGGLMLLLACLNYINLAIVLATKRLKEIGVRKMMGAVRRGVITQFLFENLVTTGFATILGWLVAWLIFIPGFSHIAHINYSLDFTDPYLWIISLLIMVTTSVVSGLYPALFISKFKAITIFKSAVKFKSRNPLTKILLGVQLVLACVTITNAITFVQNNAFQNEIDWGYNPRNMIYAKVANDTDYEMLRGAIGAHSDVLEVSGGENHVGISQTKAIVHRTDRDFEVNRLNVAPDYLATLGFELLEGRHFNPGQYSDQQSVIINHKMATTMDMSTTIGSQFRLDSVNYTIVGVIDDFHFYNFYSDIKPTIFMVASSDDFRFMTVRTESGSSRKVMEELKAQWATLIPEKPFEGNYQTDVWGDYFQSIENFALFNKAISFITVLMVCLGLYGLIAMNISNRIRELSIRMVLGAGWVNMTRLLSRQYVLIILTALIGGSWVSYLVSDAQLEMLFHYRIPSVWPGVLLASLLLVAILAIVFVIQIKRIGDLNPVDGIRSE
jgi:ABC-type antimicrobial peptide transport system permease subunit